MKHWLAKMRLFEERVITMSPRANPASVYMFSPAVLGTWQVYRDTHPLTERQCGLSSRKHRHIDMRWLVMLICVALWVGGLVTCCLAADKQTQPLRGAPFRTAWNQPSRVRLEGITLRLVLEQLCTARKLAWVADRRLDLDQSVSCDATDVPLSEIISHLLEPLQAQAVVVGSTIVIGPSESTRWLRTLTDRQRLAVQHVQNLATAKTLRTGMDIHWEELTQPRELVNQVLEQRRLRIQRLDDIPYDLWNRGDLVGVTAGELLTILVWQYDLQVEWKPNGEGVLNPLIVPLTTQRSVRLTASQKASIPEMFPDLTWTPALTSASLDRPYQATGRLEELESLEKWLRDAKSPVTSRPRTGEAAEWRQRKFATFRTDGAPLIQVLKQLKEQKLPIEWDEEQLVAFGVDLQTAITVDLKQAGLEEMVQVICEQAGLEYKVTADAISLSPKDPKE